MKSCNKNHWYNLWKPDAKIEELKRYFKKYEESLNEVSKDKIR